MSAINVNNVCTPIRFDRLKQSSPELFSSFYNEREIIFSSLMLNSKSLNAQQMQDKLKLFKLQEEKLLQKYEAEAKKISDLTKGLMSQHIEK